MRSGDRSLAVSLTGRLRWNRIHDVSVDEHLAVDRFDQYVAETAVPDVSHNAINGQRKFWFEADNVPYMMLGFGKHFSLAGFLRTV